MKLDELKILVETHDGTGMTWKLDNILTNMSPEILDLVEAVYQECYGVGGDVKTAIDAFNAQLATI